MRAVIRAKPTIKQLANFVFFFF